MPDLTGRTAPIRTAWRLASRLLGGLAAGAAMLAVAVTAVAADAPTPSPSPPPAPAPSPRHEEIDLMALQTKDLRLLYFDPAETYLVPYVARAYENSMAFQRRMWNWAPKGQVTVLMKDFSDYGNAAARSSPNDAVLLDIAPLSQTFETFSGGERFFTLMNHELTHVATMDVSDRADRKWRGLLGGKPMPLQDHPESILYNYLATPRVNVPRWYLEGSAVFMETWMAGGYGRAQGAYDEMVFRAMVRDNARFFSPLGLESEGTAVDFQVGVNDYLYGTRFISYLGLTRSPEKVVEWLRRDEGSRGYYASQFKAVFGQSLDSAWAQWIDWEHAFQKANLQSVSRYPLTPLTHLAPRALGSVSRTFVDPKTGELIGAVRYPGVIGYIGALTPGSGALRRLADIKGQMLYRVTDLAFDAEARTLFYVSDNYAYRDLMTVDLASGRAKMLIRDARIGDIVLNPKDKSLWGLRHLNGLITLVKIAAPYTTWTQVHTFPYGRNVFDLDISPDGTLLSASVGEINGEQSLKVFRLDDIGAEEPAAVAELKLASAQPEGFVFAPDGKSLYGSAYFTGVSNIYRFDLATQKYDAVSNASSGLFRPIPQADGSVIAYEFSGHGFTPVRFDPKPLEDLGTVTFLGAQIAAQHPVVKTWTVGSPASVPLEKLTTSQAPYVPFNEMRLGAIYPVTEGYKRRLGVGLHVILEDPMQFDQVTATLSYSPADGLPDDEQVHADLKFHNIAWTAEYWHNKAGFYDLFGPTERSRKGDAVLVGYHRSLIYDLPKQLDVSADVAYYTGLDTLPAAQNIATAGGGGNIASLRLGMKYSDITNSLGSVDHERGLTWAVAADEDHSGGKDYPRMHASLGAGVPVGWGHSSIWGYVAAGASGGPRANPLGSYYLGAFGNNYVDDGEVKRYRDWDSFPGFDIDAIAARDFTKGLAEWNLPPIRFSDVGTPSLYLGSIRSALFAGVLHADPPTGPGRTYYDVGGQVDFNFTFALRLPMTLSFGAASGFEHGRADQSEVFVSLKII